YNEILKMNEFPNFQGAAILGFCLNIFGLEVNKKTTSHRDVEALHKVLLTWTKKNFAAMYNYNPKIAEQCLIDGLSYEPDNLRIIKTYPIEGLRQKRINFYLEVDPPQPNKFVL
ncbi:hypothetical protein ACKERE_17795, partial [Acinetobacter baumannii]